ncbi:hypothetical protein GCK32_020819, partial [Trichostrongylus colubriformis]
MLINNTKKDSLSIKQNPKPFDGSVILEEYKDYHFGTFIFNKITLCSINSLESETGFYQ